MKNVYSPYNKSTQDQQSKQKTNEHGINYWQKLNKFDDDILLREKKQQLT